MKCEDKTRETRQEKRGNKARQDKQTRENVKTRERHKISPL